MRAKTYLNKNLKRLGTLVILTMATSSLMQCKSSNSKEQLQIHRIKSSEASFFSNSHIIEGKSSLVVVDVHMAQKDVEVLIDSIKKLSKPLEAIIITHRHPDHLNGLEFFVKQYPDTPIYAGTQTTEAIMLNQKAWDIREYKIIPEEPGFITLAGREFEIQVFSDAESPESLVLYDRQSKSLLTGDLVLHKQHLWLAEMQIDNWKETLINLKEHFNISTIYPGHGESGNVQLIDYTIDYLDFFTEIVQNASSYSEAEMVMKNKFPDHKFSKALEISLGAFNLLID
ncbi:MAG: MBL fold metallo-hydrolase [Winogradskyella sp.]|nr:MAG: MBL fold metallo-hydrolase [Winogradskyella sp.]